MGETLAWGLAVDLPATRPLTPSYTRYIETKSESQPTPDPSRARPPSDNLQVIVSFPPSRCAALHTKYESVRRQILVTGVESPGGV